MIQENFKRKLTAIFSADVAGYSRLMGEDDEWTLRVYRQFQGVINDLVNSYHGRVFGAAGDSMMAEFNSPVEAASAFAPFPAQ